MNIIIRFLIGLAGMAGALGAALATMEGGNAMTLANLGDIPLVAWLSAFVSFVAGFLSGKPVGRQHGKYKGVNGVGMMLAIALVSVGLVGCNVSSPF